ncbi:MAG TPA: hypothetical protein DIT01_07155 [Lentisphaeria bacterium]|nr:hypothetical protein [Lentisphaeria bacterium]
MAAVILVLCSPGLAAAAEDVLLFDDFDKPLDPATWALPEKPPWCENSTVLVTPNAGFHSRKVFGQPISVAFEGLYMTQSDTPSDNNNIGITPGHSENMICFRVAHGKLYAVRRHEGTIYGEPDTISPGEWGTFVGNIATRAKDTRVSKPYDLRIDWWPGQLVRYYVNGKMVAEYFDHVMTTASPIGVRDECAYFRIGSVKVTRPAGSADEILAQMAKARAAARRAKEAPIRAEAAARQARAEARVKALGRQFPPMRMVIGGPSYCWGIDPVIKTDLERAGMQVVVWPDAPMLTPSIGHDLADPMHYNVIIYGDTFYHLVQPDPGTGELPERIRKQVPPLRRFLEAGGGIWFCGLGEQNWGRSVHALNYILEQLDLDAAVVGEVVKDGREIKAPASRYSGYAWVDVLPDPLTAGVENLLSPSGVVSGEGSMGVCPIARLGPDWRVLLRGKPTAASYPAVQTDAAGRLEEQPGTIGSAPILCAVRQAGKGRVVLWPTWSSFTVTGGSGGMLVDGRHEETWSDGARLIENLTCWLAEPSRESTEVGTLDAAATESGDAPVDVAAGLAAWRKTGRRDYPRQFKGLIGAHSDLSDGQSSPQEMIAAARAAGYDFIAFTEDLAAMDADKWARLLAVCDQANDNDGAFIAYPGLDFMDEAGNRGLHFGQRYWIKDEWRSRKNPDRIRWWHNLAYAADADAKRWPPRVIIRSQTNNKRPWYQGLWSFFGAYCYEAGELVDDSFHEWRRLIGPHVYFMNTALMAVHTVRSTDEIAAAARAGAFQSYVRADNLAQVLSRLRGCVGPMGYFPTYISQGPEIQDFRCYAAVMGGETSFDLATPGNDHGLLHIRVQSDAGLAEIAVYDGERLYRRFRPEGAKVYDTFVTILADAHHCYSMTVTDMQGQKAHSWNAYLQIQEKVHRRCGDNWNWMTTGKGPGSLEPPAFRYHLLEVTSGWQPRDAPTDAPAPRPKYRCEQGDYGHGGLSGAINGYLRPEGCLVDGKPWPATAYPIAAMALSFETIGRYGVILTALARDELMVLPKLEDYTIGAFSGPYEVAPSPWPADLRQFAPMQKPGGLTANRYQGKVRFTKNVVAPADAKMLRIGLGATGSPTATVFELVGADGVAVRHRGSKVALTGTIPQGGYICWYDADGDGVGGVIALTSGVQYSYTTDWQSCFVEVPSPVAAGTEVAWDVIFVSGSGRTRESRSEMEDIRAGMGVAGTPTLYEVRPKSGRVVDQRYFLTLEAEDGGFSGSVVKTTAKPLPIHLPVMLRGLNPRWSAVIHYRGRSHLHRADYYRDRWGHQTWRWIIASYEPQVDAVRPIPVLDDGTGYCQVETDKQDPDIFIGHALVCDRREIFITLVNVGKGECTFEVNNPGDQAVTCTVRPASGFELTGDWERQVVLPAGGFASVTVGRSRGPK